MTRGSQQRPWVLAEVVSTHRRRHRGALWFRAINSASIHSSFFFHPYFCCSPFESSSAVSVCLLPSVSLSDTHFFKLKRFPRPVLRLSSKVWRGGIKWLSEDVTSKWPAKPLNDKTLDRNQSAKLCFLSECYWEKQKHLNRFYPLTLNLWFTAVLTEQLLYCIDWYLHLSTQN